MEEKLITEHISEINKEYNKIKKIKILKTILLSNMFTIIITKSILKIRKEK